MRSITRRTIGVYLTALVAVSCGSASGAAGLPSTTQSVLPSGPVTYTAQVFMPGMKVTVPSADRSTGWTLYEDHPGEFTLAAPDRLRDGVIHFWLDPIASSVHDKPIPGVGHTPAALVDWLRHDPDLVVSPPRPAMIAGEIKGTRVDIRISPKVHNYNTTGCDGGPCFDWLTFRGRNHPDANGGGFDRLYLATLRSGEKSHVLAIHVNAPDAKTLAGMIPIAAHIVANVVLPATVSAG